MAIILLSTIDSSSLPTVKVNIEMDSWAQLRKIMILNGRGGISVVTWLYGILLNISSFFSLGMIIYLFIYTLDVKTMLFRETPNMVEIVQE